MNTANTLLEQLLEHEPTLTSEEYLKYRRRVEDAIRKAQRQERTVRLVTKIAWAVTGVILVLGCFADAYRDTFPDLWRLRLIVATMMCTACAVAFSVFYLINYRPRLRMAEQQAMLLGLERQLHELRMQIGHTRRAPEPVDEHDPAPTK